ncbi:IS110 family transposase [Cereibacter changlensis]|uniref:IS110 family transposase n=1 Tax=Cereibacter changlensis TaxID=402884 RepID=A0A4U0YXP5_9RHOB|nr:IS110 family transposase [Cereibacter changlensis]
MKEITTVGLDLAESLFQVHGVDAEGAVLVRRQVKRAQLLLFLSRLRPCLIGMEACAGAHHWGRELTKLGHEVRLIPPSYVKPFVKRGKTDAADAEAICSAVNQPTMRFVPVKTEVQQAVLMSHGTRDFLMRQLKGVHNMNRLVTEAEAAALPAGARMPLDLLAQQFRATRRRASMPSLPICAARWRRTRPRGGCK